MSGICGIVFGKGRMASAGDIAPVLAALTTRGPEGSRITTSGAAALGHALLATTPEALSEPQPYVHHQTGCILTGDLRLDNRVDLIASLGLDRAAPPVGDAQLVVSAYLKWGAECLPRLIGDFALALWDPRHQRLLCARDHAAMRPLVYHHVPGRQFAFASAPEALLRHPAISSPINEARIADFAERRESYDFTSTFFTDIHRLPPAHALILENGAVQVYRYWDLAPPQQLRLGSDAAYAEAFRDILTRAVGDRLRSAGPVGAMLSGGMDSGSIVAVAAGLLNRSGRAPLTTFSAVSTDPACIETQTIRASQTIAHIDPVSISLGDFVEFQDDLAAVTRRLGEPFDTMPWNSAVYLAARRRGIKVVLDGAGGDTTLHADNMIAWHLRRGHIHQAWREARGEERFYGPEEPALRAALVAVRHVVMPQFLRDLRRRLTTASRQRHADESSVLAKNLMQRVDVRARRDEFSRRIATRLDGKCEDRRHLVLHRYILTARERYDRIAAQWGVEARDPYLDRRLLEFAVSLPPEQLQRDGWPKIIQRHAMDGLIPDAVRWRVGKQHVGWEFEAALTNSGLLEPSQNGLASASLFFKSEKNECCDAAEKPPREVAPGRWVRYTALWIDKLTDHSDGVPYNDLADQS